jgi:hypothetical protein
MNLIVTGLLCLLLVAAMLTRGATRSAPKDAQETDAAPPAAPSSTRATRGLPQISLGRLRRTAKTDAPEAPRQRRNRPRLALSVSGVPAPEAVPDGAPESDQPERADEAVQESGATGEGALQVEAAEWIDLPEPDVTAEAAETLLLDFSPGALDLASYVDSVAPVPVGGEFIDAPGWPVPGEMADFSVDLFDPQPSTDVVDAPVAHDADTASNDQVSATSEAASTWDETALIEWADEPAEAFEAAEVPSDDWAADVPVDALVGVTVAGAENSPSWDVHAWSEPAQADRLEDDATDGAWEDPDWSWEEGQDVVAAEADEPVSSDSVVPDEIAWATGLHDEFPVPVENPFPVQDDQTAWVDEPLIEAAADAMPPTAEIRAAAVTDEEAPHAPRTRSEADVQPERPVVLPAPEASLPRAEAFDVPGAPAATPAKPALTRTKASRRLEKRLATAEAELEKIAKKTTAKKGELRTASKKQIAKRVGAVLADPQIAQHFDIRVAKGTLSYTRRSVALPVLRVGTTDPSSPGATGIELLAALEGPIRASLLSNLLADYANAEAERRIAEVLRQHRAPRHAPDEFDALVGRLSEISQGRLLGIAPAHRDAVETSKGVPPTARGRLGHLTHDA